MDFDVSEQIDFSDNRSHITLFFNQSPVDLIGESYNQINPNGSYIQESRLSENYSNHGNNNEISFDFFANNEGDNENELDVSKMDIQEKQWIGFFDSSSIENYLPQSTKSTTQNNLKKQKLFKVEIIDDNSDIKAKCKKIYEKLNKIRQYRRDYYFKAFKTKFIKWMINKLNKIKYECNFEVKLQNFKKPNSKKFTSNPKINFNYNKLDQSVKQILILGGEEKENNRQSDNNQLLIQIQKFKCENKNKYNELENFLNINLKEAYYEFYNDEKAYGEMCRDEVMLFYEYGFQLETKFKYSLLEKYGFIKVLEDFH